MDKLIAFQLKRILIDLAYGSHIFSLAILATENYRADSHVENSAA